MRECAAGARAGIVRCADGRAKGRNADQTDVHCAGPEGLRSRGSTDVEGGHTLRAGLATGPMRFVVTFLTTSIGNLHFEGTIIFGKKAMIFSRSRNQRPKATRQVSVILRRQVPIQYDEPVRSWLGGLPMMPEPIDWPRDAEGAPLHFLAQIACSDLPLDLWNGHGPRTGWLLLFVETTKTIGVANSGRERVLHIKDLGPERPPPEDEAIGRPEQSGPRDVRGGLKLWRKWPVDLVAQHYDLTGTEADAHGSPCIPAEDLYGAAVSERGITHDFSEYGIEHPATWRGALHFVEALLHDLDPERFKDRFLRSFGLLDAPELDRHGFDEAFQQRVNENPDWVALGIGMRRADCYISAQIENAVKTERRNGWMANAYSALDRERARHEKLQNQYQNEIDAGGDSLAPKRRARLGEWIDITRRCINETEDARAKLFTQFAAYEGPEGERAFTDEIRSLGEAHLVWGEMMARRLGGLVDTIRTKDLDTPLSAEDWAGIARAVETDRSVYWRKYGSSGLEKTEVSLSTRRHLVEATREDFLNFYTRSHAARAMLKPEHLEKFESQLRHLEQGIPHRMGGQANMMPHETGALGEALLFQIATDVPMGWMPQHFNMPCVMTSEKNLWKHQFDQIYVTTGGY